jgi:hypothetical protein
MATIEGPVAERSFLRGARGCLGVIREIGEKDEGILDGRPQRNEVLNCMDEILRRGDRLELVGFCAALTHGLAYTNVDDLEYRELAEYLAERETLMRRRWIRAVQTESV